jgi:hypothetical protein
MNLPGTASGNWRWRCPSEALTPELAGRLARMAQAYDRQAVNEVRREVGREAEGAKGAKKVERERDAGANG